MSEEHHSFVGKAYEVEERQGVIVAGGRWWVSWDGNRRWIEEAQKQKARAEKAEAERDRLVAALDRAEWDANGYCPVCEAHYDRGHLDDCSVSAALAENRRDG